ncbi:TSC22 domain family protein 4 [Terrapene carolina triunguis]|uniref:TSC22 domain family protein 4 n=1 Tax=Terrapene triunguis TaxID=2587831 RepID=UPI000E77F48A|nr:TSC22 domain family protein 4 [Terrapene carolina triunguis]
MSGARKKSSFQITSITSEFEPPVAPPALELPEDTAAPRNGPPGAASRFRLVKLDQGPGEPFKRGRWTCLEFYDHDPEHQAVGRLLGAPRHPQSLDSRLELAGLLPKPHGYFSPPPPPRGHGHSQGTAHPGEHLPRSLGGGERTPGSRAHSHVAAMEQSLGVEELLLPHSLAQRIRREMEERHKVPPRGSRPSSPAPPFFREGSPVRRGSDPFGGLARSMFAMGGHQDSDDESGSGSSMIAIDNKIEQAMDLVKSHLMFAVREEVEVLREQIKELAERNAALEWENGLLRSLASPEQLAQLRRPTI